MKKRLIALCLALAFVLAALPGNLVSLAADSLGDLGVQPNQGAANGEQSGGNASDGVVINNGVTGEVTDSEGNPVLDANGKPLQVVVGGDLPEGSTVQATDHSSAVNDENVGILDVTLNDGDGNKWQPAPGETVQVGVMFTFPYLGKVFGLFNVAHALFPKFFFQTIAWIYFAIGIDKEIDHTRLAREHAAVAFDIIDKTHVEECTEPRFGVFFLELHLNELGKIAADFFFVAYCIVVFVEVV